MKKKNSIKLIIYKEKNLNYFNYYSLKCFIVNYMKKKKK
jgi:hypothetical protein